MVGEFICVLLSSLSTRRCDSTVRLTVLFVCVPWVSSYWSAASTHPSRLLGRRSFTYINSSEGHIAFSLSITKWFMTWLGLVMSTLSSSNHLVKRCHNFLADCKNVFVGLSLYWWNLCRYTSLVTLKYARSSVLYISYVVCLPGSLLNTLLSCTLIPVTICESQ